jgi:hypothetical protein
VIAAIERLLKDDTAGDPMGGLRWTRKTTEKISGELASASIEVSPNTVGRLLCQLGYALRVNHKKRAVDARHPDRNQQFEYVLDLRQAFKRRGLPVISMDTKKKELVGHFKNAGSTWRKTPDIVNDHDFRSDANGIAIPYGIYDEKHNHGYVVIGTSHETPAFAADAISRWWVQDGRSRYPEARKLLILADGGGANGARKNAWKCELQAKVCDAHRLAVTVCHYPPGASKWNPIEHRLFSEISKNWAGKPLDSHETMLKYIRTTKTRTGLRVRATLSKRNYETRVTPTRDQVARLNLRRHNSLPNWNYTLSPRPRRKLSSKM